jgi:hypothetical protein
MPDDPELPDPDGFPAPGGSGILDAGLDVIFVIFGVGVAVVLLLGLIAAARRRRALLDAGLDPRLTPQEQLAAGLARQQQHGGPRSPSALPADGAGASRPQRTTEERLRELDDLLRREVISAQEHARARAEVLREL